MPNAASWFARILGRDKKLVTQDPDANLVCAFCGRHRREVFKLIAGNGVCICDSCIALSVHILDEEDPNNVYYATLVLGHLRERPRLTRHDVVRPRLRGVLELASGSHDQLRALFGVAIRFSDLETALAAMAAIPAASQTARDRLDTVAALIDSDRHAQALGMLDSLDENALGGTDRIAHKLHRAFTELERGSCTPVRLAVHRKTALDLEPALTALPEGTIEDRLRAEQLAVLTLAYLGLGELDEAERVARERAERQPTNAVALDHLARVLDARGDRAGAAIERNKALEHAHPDGVIGRKLRAAMAATGPFR